MAESKRTLTRSSLVTGNVTVSGRRTSVRLEKEMWTAFEEIAKRERSTVNDLAGRINRRKKKGQGFTSAVRVFLMVYYRDLSKSVRRMKSRQRK